MYYTLKTIKQLLESANLKIYNTQLSDANGGSIGIFACKQSSDHKSEVDLDQLINLESQKLPRLLVHFRENVQKLKETVVSFLVSEKLKGKTIWGIGASTKGNTILNFFGLDAELVSAIADKNPLKLGRVTPGTRIPIKPKESLLEANPDFAIVLPWHFRKSITENEQKFLNKGGKLLFPLPDFTIVDNLAH
jgi:hypothetical protein